MSNPYFSNSAAFGDDDRKRSAVAAETRPGQGGYGTQTGYAPRYDAQAPGQYPMDSFEQQYAAPSAAPSDTRRMTYDDVIVKSAIVLGVIVAVAVAIALATVSGALSYGAATGLMVVGAIGGLILGLVNAFKRNPSPPLILAYAALEGLFLGGISMFMEMMYPGIVIQAVLGTFGVAVASLALFAFRVVRVTPKFTRFLLIGLVGYALFALTNFILQITGLVQDPWGLRSGVEIMGIPLGVFVGAFAVLLAAMSLIVDFDSIERAVKAGVPERYSWAAAFGLAVTLVWLYLEILRLLAILRGNE